MSAFPGVARQAGLSLVLFLFAFGLSAPLAAAYHTGAVKAANLSVSETITLPTNTYSGYTFTIGNGDRLSYDLRVTSGSPIDMYVVSADNLLRYRNDSTVSFFATVRVENRTTISDVFTGTPQTAGADTLIVDNTDLSGAVPTGAVTVSVNLRREPPPAPNPLPIGGAIAAVVVGVAVIALLVLRARRRHAYAGALRPYARPPYSPPQQPPQGPYPPPPPAP